MWMESRNIWSLVTGFSNLAKCFQRSALMWHAAVRIPFLYGGHILFLHPLMDVQLVSTSWLL